MMKVYDKHKTNVMLFANTKLFDVYLDFCQLLFSGLFDLFWRFFYFGVFSLTPNSTKMKSPPIISQGSHRLEKYLNLEGFLEKSLKID